MTARPNVQFNLRSLFVAITLCGVEAALIAAARTTPEVTVIPAMFLGYYLLACPFAAIVVWLKSSRIASLDETFAFATFGLTYFVVAIICAIFALIVLSGFVSLLSNLVK